MYKPPLLVIFLFMLSAHGSVLPILADQINNSPAQDSLDNLIIATAGQQKVDLLNNAFFYIHKENFDKARANAQLALELSERLNYQKGSALALLNIGYVHFLRNKIDSASADYDKAIQIIHDSNLKELLPIAYNHYGLMLWRKSDFLGAAKYYRKAVAEAKLTDNMPELARAYNNIGLIYWKSGDYAECNDYFIRALKIRDEIGEPFDRVITLNNLARFFYEVNDFKRCLDYSQKALAIAKSVEDHYGIGRAHSNMGFAYSGLKNYTKAIESLNNSLAMKQFSNDIPGIAFSLSEIGQVYFEQGNLEQALEYFNRALQIRKQIRSIYGIADNYKQIALVYIRQNNYPKAIEYLNQSLSIAQASDMKDIMRSCYEALAKTSESQGDYATSLKYYKNFIALKDSIEGRSKTDRIAQLTNTYENEAREREIIELTNLQKIQELEIDKKNVQILALWFSLLLVLGFISYYYYKYRSEKKIKKELEYSNTTKDKLFSIIAHDLRSPFIGLLGYAEILREDYHDLPDEMRMQYITNIDKTIKELFKLLEGLLEWAKVQSRSLTYKPEKIVLSEVADNAVVLLQQAASNKDIGVQVEIPKDVSVFADAQMIYSIFRNLLSNAIKFSDSGQCITISVTAEDELVTIKVRDTGAGIPAEHIGKLFTPGSKFSTSGTRGEKGTGVGLSIVSELVKINKGTIRVESTLGKGSTFIVTLPKMV